MFLNIFSIIVCLEYASGVAVFFKSSHNYNNYMFDDGFFTFVSDGLIECASKCMMSDLCRSFTIIGQSCVGYNLTSSPLRQKSQCLTAITFDIEFVNHICNDGFNIGPDGICYKVVPVATPLPEAIEHCTALKSSLLMLESTEKQNSYRQVQEIINYASSWWVAGYGLSNNMNDWKWFNGQTIGNLLWNAGEPNFNDHCVEAQGNKLSLNNVPCDKEKYFICEKICRNCLHKKTDTDDNYQFNVLSFGNKQA